MAEVIDMGIMFDPLYQEIIQGLVEIVHESAEMDKIEVAAEMRQCSNDIKSIAMDSINRIRE